MKILSIGNSFSQDAHKWIYPIAKELGEDFEVVNLYIGGCSLKTHWNNFLSGVRSYDYEVNGEKCRRSSIGMALSERRWDVITLQQVSAESGIAESYEPYLTQLVHYIRKSQPQAKLYLHQTWAYDQGSDWSGFAAYNHSTEQMFVSLKTAYQDAAKRIGADIVPVGEVLQQLRTYPEFASITRDGGHLSYIYGRYAAALTWIATLRDVDVRKVGFLPEHEGVKAAPQLLEQIKQTVYTF